MNDWIHVKGHSELHPVKYILKDCCEYGNNKIKSFGWTATRDATILGTKKNSGCPSVVIPKTPPWLLPMPQVDFYLQDMVKN